MDMTRATVQARLERLRGVIDQILSITGCPGMSIGVIHHGEITYKASFGHRDISAGLPMTTETTMPISSLTKTLTCSALAILRDRRQIDWDSPVSELVPDYAPADELLKHVPLSAFLSMSSGMEPYDIWHQGGNRIGIPKQSALDVLNTLRLSTIAGLDFSHNDWGYEIARLVVERCSGGEQWDDFVHEHIVERLGMTSTDVRGARDELGQASKHYGVLDDGTPFEIPPTPASGRTLMGAAAGALSCVDDLLALYQAYIDAIDDQTFAGEAWTFDNPFKHVLTCTDPHIRILTPNKGNMGYGLGWMWTQLPGHLNFLSKNWHTLGTGPLFGQWPRHIPEVLSQSGSMPGSHATVHIAPSTKTAVIVLTNATPLADTSDYVGMMLLEACLNPDADCLQYLGWVRQTVAVERSWEGRLRKELQVRRMKHSLPASPHEIYEGRYWNESRTLMLEVRKLGILLALMFDGSYYDAWPLTHVDRNEYSWIAPRDDLVTAARVTGQPLSYYSIKFEELQTYQDTARTMALYWSHDPRSPKGEKYTRE